MQNIFALLQSDPNLLACQLERLRGVVDLGADPLGALGLGYYATGDVLLRKRPNVRGADVATLAGEVESQAVVLYARQPGGPAFDDESTPPFRFRRWLWVQSGDMEGFADYRAALTAALPDFLQRALKSDTDGELMFLHFAARLRDQGRIDDLDLDAQTAAAMLGQAVARVDEIALQAGQKRPQLAMAGTNGRVLVAARRGRPLWYALLEGIVPCLVHQIDAATPDHNVLVRPHHRVRGVALASSVRAPNGWVEVPEGSSVGVSRTLEVGVASL